VPRFASLRRMNPAHASPDPRWAPASGAEHLLAGLDGAEVGRGVRLAAEVGPPNSVGARYFRAFLEVDALGRTREPVLRGLANQGPYPGFNWVEVTAFDASPYLEDGRQLEIPEAVDLQIVRALAAPVPPGGHLMLEYDSHGRRLTAQALAARVPPVATPLGAMMFAAGCGVAFRDWYISEGGREGPRKLQGFRAIDASHERARAGPMLADLQAFMARSKELDWHVQARTRPLAEATIAALRARLELPEGPPTPPGNGAELSSTRARRARRGGAEV